MNAHEKIEPAAPHKRIPLKSPKAKGGKPNHAEDFLRNDHIIAMVRTHTCMRICEVTANGLFWP